MPEERLGAERFFRNAEVAEEEREIYRGEVLAITGALADIDVNSGGFWVSSRTRTRTLTMKKKTTRKLPDARRTGSVGSAGQ